MDNVKSVSVFCASSNKMKTEYTSAATRCGELLALDGIHVFYGGGGRGLMGTIADTILEGGGRITGVIPRFMIDEEWHHPGVADMVYVETMAERKKILIERSQGILALPGSIGTFEELMEVLSLKKLGFYFNPVVILNTLQYYDPLIEMLSNAAKENFMRPEHTGLWKVANTPEEAIHLLNTTPAWPGNARSFASA